MDAQIVAPLVIAFGFKARNGKDTCVQEIIKHCPGAKRYAFATELKREVNEMAEAHGGIIGLITYLHTHGTTDRLGRPISLPSYVKYHSDAPMDDPECPLGKHRTLLQFWGQHRRENFDNLYWVKKVRSRIIEESPDIALISDLRYKNELFWVKQEYKDYGFSVLVERTGYIDPSVNSSHVSEQELADTTFDFEIRVRDGELDELKSDALIVFQMIIDRISLGMEEVPTGTSSIYRRDELDV